MNIKDKIIKNTGMCGGIVASITVIVCSIVFSSLAIEDTGDRISLISAVISGLVFVWLIAGYHLQREELVAQRNELELQRTELKNQHEALILQKNEMRQSNKHGAMQQIFTLVNDFRNSYHTRDIDELNNEKDCVYLTYKGFCDLVIQTLQSNNRDAQAEAYDYWMKIKFLYEDLFRTLHYALNIYAEAMEKQHAFEYDDFLDSLKSPATKLLYLKIPYIYSMFSAAIQIASLLTSSKIGDRFLDIPGETLTNQEKISAAEKIGFEALTKQSEEYLDAEDHFKPPPTP